MGQEGRENDPMLESWIESITAVLAAVDNAYVQACSISIVPDQLKKSNEDAYMPKVVSIGPLYRGTKRDLLYMKEIKLRCMLSLFHRAEKAEKSLEECCKAILSLDKVVRASYLSDIKLDEYELANIMLLDGCFLLELLITGSQEELKDIIPKSRLEPPGPGPHIGKMEKVLSDLTLLENQIPIVILHKLSTLLFPDVFTNIKEKTQERIEKINNLALSLLCYSPDSNPGHSPDSNPDASHFLELVHSFISGNGKKVMEIQESQHSSIDVKSEQVEGRELKLKRCATMLKAAGVTIEASDNPAVKVSCFDVDISFRDGTLKILPLHITETTKAKWLNFIAWEHHKIWKSSSTAVDQGTTGLSFKFSWSALVFNGLICHAADVQLLKDIKVIEDHLKMSNEDLMTFFRTISMGVDHSIVDSSYIEMCDGLNKYSTVNYAKQISIIWWHKYLRCALEWLYNVLKRQYNFVANFLKRDYNFVVTVIPILTIVQTILAVLSYHDDNKYDGMKNLSQSSPVRAAEKLIRKLKES